MCRNFIILATEKALSKDVIKLLGQLYNNSTGKSMLNLILVPHVRKVRRIFLTENKGTDIEEQ